MADSPCDHEPKQGTEYADIAICRHCTRWIRYITRSGRWVID